MGSSSATGKSTANREIKFIIDPRVNGDEFPVGDEINFFGSFLKRVGRL